jgi:hypothetical protein
MKTRQEIFDGAKAVADAAGELGLTMQIGFSYTDDDGSQSHWMVSGGDIFKAVALAVHMQVAATRHLK